MAAQAALLAVAGATGLLSGAWSAAPLVTALLAASAVAVTALGLVAGMIAALTAASSLILLWGSVFLYAMATAAPPPLAADRLFLWLLLVLAAAPAAGYVRRRGAAWLTEPAAGQEQQPALTAHDPVTGLDNAECFATGLREEAARARRHRLPLALLLVQVRFFQEFSRLYGQPEADHLMKSLAEQMRARVRACDRIFRVRPDTFALLLMHTDAKSAGTVAAHLETSLKDHALRNQPLGVTLTLAFGAAGHLTAAAEPGDMLDAAEEELNHYVL